MRIQDYKELIRTLPYNEQSFDIKADIWIDPSKKSKIDDIFNKQNVITISREDLFNSVDNLEVFLIKTLMWGYPTKGRGSNIENLLENCQFHDLIGRLNVFLANDLSTDDLNDVTSKCKGLGLSTLSKLLYFLRSSVCGYKAVILDQKIKNVINNYRFEELKCLRHKSKISRHNELSIYPTYLKVINETAKGIAVDPGQVELFLFMFGNNLKNKKNEG